ncbi:MAG: AMP-binding protein [Candidatus Methylomirabilales bacterium]
MLLLTTLRFPEKPALYCLGKALKYRELLAMVYAVGDVLRNMGVQPDDRVAIILPNCPQRVITDYGVLSIGAITVPINPLLTKTECTKILRNAKPKVIITLDQFLPIIAKRFISQCAILVTHISDFASFGYTTAIFLRDVFKKKPVLPQTHVSFRDVLSALEKRECAYVRSQPDDIATLLYTSGTTGEPKGVMLTHRNILVNLVQCKAFSTTLEDGEEVFLSVIPFFHAYGLTVGMHLSVMLGAYNVLVPKFSGKTVVQLLKSHRVTVWPAIPALLHALVKYKTTLTEATKHLKVITCGGSKLPEEHQLKFESLSNCRVSPGFGMSELSPVALLTPRGVTHKLGTMGIPIADTDARIVDLENGKDVSAGKMGELIIRGPQVMQGYWQNEKKTAEVLKGEWLFTGDLAWRDDDHFFYYIERKDDMIKVGSEKVQPSEVERHIAEHPGVAEVVVVSVPDDFRGSVVKACVVPRKEGALTADDIITFCKEGLAPFKVPRLVDFLDEIPKNILKKPLRRKLAQQDSNTDREK